MSLEIIQEPIAQNPDLYPTKWIITDDIYHQKIMDTEKKIIAIETYHLAFMFIMQDEKEKFLYFGYSNTLYSLNPLLHYGIPAAGCTSIKYAVDGVWKEPKTTFTNNF